jgi:catalase
MAAIGATLRTAPISGILRLKSPNRPLPLKGAAWRYDPKDDPTDNCFEQPGKLYRLMSEEKKALLIGNTVTGDGWGS